MPPTLPDLPVSSSAEDLASLSLLGFGLEPSSVSWSSTTGDQTVKVQLPFNFLDGNKFPCEWEWVTFELLVVVVSGAEDLWLLPVFPASRQQGEIGINDRIFTINLVGQHLPILGAKAFIEAILLHLPPHAPVGFYWDTPSWVSELVGIGVLWTQPHSLPFPAWGNKAPCLGHQISSQHHNVCPASGGHCPGWHPYPNSLLGLLGILAKT